MYVDIQKSVVVSCYAMLFKINSYAYKSASV